MYNLKKKRLERGLSREELAEKSGVPIRKILYYEAEAASAHRDINNAGALHVWKLSQALDCDITEILEMDEDDDV